MRVLVGRVRVRECACVRVCACTWVVGGGGDEKYSGGSQMRIL